MCVWNCFTSQEFKDGVDYGLKVMRNNKQDKEKHDQTLVELIQMVNTAIAHDSKSKWYFGLSVMLVIYLDSYLKGVKKFPTQLN